MNESESATVAEPLGEETKVAVVGMGYVGTSIAAVLSEGGLAVRGVDVDESRVREVNAGDCPIEEDGITAAFERNAEAGQLEATADFGVVESCEVVVVTVGTPLDGTIPDVTAVTAAAESVGAHLRQGHLVIFRSTMPPGTTVSKLRPILEEESGLAAGVEFDLAFCPERMAEGSAYDDLTGLPVVVGGVTNRSRIRAAEFWRELGIEAVGVSDPTTAELTKLVDNWWIDLNIALANEVALLAEEIGVDAVEAIRAANTLPKGEHHVNVLFPGTGVGGSCLVKDPWFVATLGDEHGLDLRTPRVSRQVNDRMPVHLVNLTADAIGELADAEVAALGYAFKSGTDDTRNTPARPVVRELERRGANVRITDPYVPGDVIEEETGMSPARLPDALDGADAVAILTGHETYRTLSVEALRRQVGCDDFAVVDGRRAFDADEFADTGITYRAVGDGSVTDE